jgi:hypothetical protein
VEKFLADFTSCRQTLDYQTPFPWEPGVKKIDSRDVYVKVGEGGDGIKDYLLLDEKEVVGCSELVANVVLQVNVKDKWRWEPDPFEGYSLKAKCMLFSTSLYKWDFVVVKKLV